MSRHSLLYKKNTNASDKFLANSINTTGLSALKDATGEPTPKCLEWENALAEW